MIWIAPLLMLVVFVIMEIHVLRSVDGDAHERCLRNIGRLESQLFPDLPSELRWAPWPPRSSVQSHPSPYGAAQVSFAPGQKWPVANPNYVQMVMPGIPWHALPRRDRELLDEESAFLKHEDAIGRLNQVTAEYRLVFPPPGGWTD